jgi:hypothetical protein
MRYGGHPTRFHSLRFLALRFLALRFLAMRFLGFRCSRPKWPFRAGSRKPRRLARRSAFSNGL